MNFQTFANPAANLSIPELAAKITDLYRLIDDDAERFSDDDFDLPGLLFHMEEELLKRPAESVSDVAAKLESVSLAKERSGYDPSEALPHLQADLARLAKTA